MTTCPVCRQPITHTEKGHVRAHPDTAGNRCPMSKRRIPLPPR